MTAPTGATTGESVRFVLPADLEAAEPPEVRGRGRHDVRLIVARRHEGTLEHLRFTDIVDVLAPGDLVVLNTSATVPAALAATRADGTRLWAHLSTRPPGRALAGRAASPGGHWEPAVSGRHEG